MSINKQEYLKLIGELQSKNVTIVAVSKTKPADDILELYNLGQRDFAENYVQELVDKAGQLPKDIRWHFIGHLQTNKVKSIAPFVQLIQSVDSLKLLKEINKHGEKQNKVIDCLLQVHIAEEETKFGLDEKEINELINQWPEMKMNKVRICGLMGMASFTSDLNKVRSEFRHLKTVFDKFCQKQTSNFSQSPADKLQILSMGMSGDHKIAIEEGSNMVRIGSLLFGEREKKG